MGTKGSDGTASGKQVKKEKQQAEGVEYRPPGGGVVEGVTAEEVRSGEDGRGALGQQTSGQGPTGDAAASARLPPASHEGESTCAAGQHMT